MIDSLALKEIVVNDSQFLCDEHIFVSVYQNDKFNEKYKKILKQLKILNK